MKLDIKRCPYCGEKVVLIPPERHSFPRSMGISANGIEFCVKPRLSLFSYTHDPSPHINTECFEDKHFFETNNISYDGFVHNSKNPRFRCITANYITRQISRGGYALYKENIFFLCKNCRNKIAINFNPWRTTLFPQIFWTFALCIFLLLFFMSFEGLVALVPPGMVFVLSVFCTLVYFVILIFLTKHFEKYRSNFAPVDEFDALVPFSVNIITNNNLDKMYYYESNIFSVEVDKMNFHLYLVHKRANPEFHICGINGEPELLFSLLREKMNNGEKIVLPMMFEGKIVGNAEVLEIFEPIKSNAML